MALSGTQMRLVDSSPGAFLMPAEGISDAAEPDCALVLSELYGIPYDIEALRTASGKNPRVRILDLAMCIPSPERMKQLEAKDIALFSFGWGKPMYAGWGGIACFQNPEFAGKVREIRQRWNLGESLGLRIRHGFSALFHSAANQHNLYGLWHQRHLYRLHETLKSLRKRYGRLPAREVCAPLASAPTAQTLRPEWTRPMTPLNRKLAVHNLRNAPGNIAFRRRQAEIYYKLLVAPGIVRGPGNNSLPQSHFPIRIEPAVRDRMCDFLRGRGIDTGKLFPFPCGLTRSSYPHASGAADEVVTLPMGPSITLDEVKSVAECVKDGLRVSGF
jgi:dTDP-4-amino-4,6-dideoxygalactose transaminase